MSFVNLTETLDTINTTTLLSFCSICSAKILQQTEYIYYKTNNLIKLSQKKAPQERWSELPILFLRLDPDVYLTRFGFGNSLGFGKSFGF